MIKTNHFLPKKQQDTPTLSSSFFFLLLKLSRLLLSEFDKVSLDDILCVFGIENFNTPIL